MPALPTGAAGCPYFFVGLQRCRAGGSQRCSALTCGVSSARLWVKIPRCEGFWMPCASVWALDASIPVVQAAPGGPVRTGEAARPGRMGAPLLWEAVVSGRGACSTLEALQARLTPRISAWMTEEAFTGSRWDVASPPRQQGAFLAAPSCAPGYPHPILMLPSLFQGYEARGTPLRADSHPALCLHSCCEPVHLPAGAPGRPHGPAHRAARRQARLRHRPAGPEAHAAAAAPALPRQPAPAASGAARPPAREGTGGTGASKNPLIFPQNG